MSRFTIKLALRSENISNLVLDTWVYIYALYVFMKYCVVTGWRKPSRHRQKVQPLTLFLLMADKSQARNHSLLECNRVLSKAFSYLLQFLCSHFDKRLK